VNPGFLWIPADVGSCSLEVFTIDINPPVAGRVLGLPQDIGAIIDAVEVDPLAVVRSLYSWLGRDLLGDVELRMRTFLSAHPNGKHGNHSYTLAAFGLDSAKLRERFSSYRTCINLTFKS